MILKIAGKKSCAGIENKNDRGKLQYHIKILNLSAIWMFEDRIEGSHLAERTEQVVDI